jgi:hypothetical protein
VIILASFLPALLVLFLLRVGISTHFCILSEGRSSSPLGTQHTANTQQFGGGSIRRYVVGGEQRIKAMNEITPTRPSKVKKSKIRPKLKPIVSPTDDNYDDEGELGMVNGHHPRDLSSHLKMILLEMVKRRMRDVILSSFSLNQTKKYELIMP